MKKEIYIFTGEDSFKGYDEEYTDKYISDNFSDYTIISTEDNKGLIINEENDAYMVME